MASRLHLGCGEPLNSKVTIMGTSGWQYFDENELSCNCGCGQQRMDKDFMRKIVLMRTELGFPFVVTSAYRCPQYNATVSKTGTDGPHTTGKAMDIQVSGHQAHKLLTAALRNGIRGIGVSQKGPHGDRFLHLDDLDDGTGPRPWVWSY